MTPNSVCVQHSSRHINGRRNRYTLNQLACIGGLVKCLESICNIAGEDSTFSYINCLVQNLKDYKFKIDFFPSEGPLMFNKDIPGAEGLLDDTSDSSSDEEPLDESFDANYNKQDGKSSPSDTSTVPCDLCTHVHSYAIQSELEKNYKMQDTGLGTAYKCPDCRSCRQCLKGPGREKLSIKQEAEQDFIRKSVKIDEKSGRAIASLAFTEDPNLNIKRNEHIALRRQ